MAAKRKSARGGSSSSRTGSSKARAGKATTRGSSRTSRSAKPLVEHDEIRQWVEERGGHPACVRGTGGQGDTGMLRIDFPDGAEPNLQPIEWCDWFEKFHEKGLALMVQSGSSRFNKLVSRDTAQTKSRSTRASKPKTRTAGR